MKFLITGGTGFIGTYLCKSLTDMGHRIVILTRNPSLGPKAPLKPKEIQIVHFINSLSVLDPKENDIEIIINLAGENLTNGRWTARKKSELYHSRLETTKQLITYISQSRIKPKLLLSGSAIGFYGESLDQTFTEDSLPATKALTHGLCQQWEEIANQAKQEGVRLCSLRTGIVLGKRGGALGKMLLPFKLGLGGPVGDGQQWMSWIHIEDVLGLIQHVIHHQDIEGPINLTAPHPVTNDEFTKTLAKVLHRPAFFRLPAWFVKIVFGEMAELLLLQGQKVLPKKALDSGYKFLFPSLEAALVNIITGA